MDRELIAYLDERFQQIEERIQSLNDAVRQTNVLVEALRGDVHLTAEGLLGLNDRFERFRFEAMFALDQTQALIEPCRHNQDGRLESVRKDPRQRYVFDSIHRMLGKPP